MAQAADAQDSKYNVFFIHNHDKNLKIKTEIQILKRTASREKCFWRSITFFIAFSKIPTKRRFERLLFLKLNQSRNTKKKKCWGFFLPKIYIYKSILKLNQSRNTKKKKMWGGFSSKDLYLQEQFKPILFCGLYDNG